MTDRAGVGPLIDPDDKATWPAELQDQVARWSAVLDDEEHWQDATPPDAVSRSLESALAGWSVLTYHCTRLLDHEVDGIRADGLQPFSRHLFDHKIQAAQDAGAITASERDALLRGHMYGCGDLPRRGAREGQVWLVAGGRDFDRDAEAFEELLLHWGGEGIYFATGAMSMKPWLQTLGKPTIVVVALPFTAVGRRHSWWGPLANLLLAAHRAIPAHGDVICWSPVPADRVVDLWQPGHPSYDRHPRLPAA